MLIHIFTENTNSKIILSMCYVDEESDLGSVSINQNDKISDSSLLSLPRLRTGECPNTFDPVTLTHSFFKKNINLIF